jgi:phenylpropionate dioxygenase-like ring-hydroxylating dioxygenase large terminal subunit
MNSNRWFADDATVVDRVLRHIDQRTTDVADRCWREPVANYRCADRLAAEQALMRRYPTPFCPSAALPEPGSYLARDAAGTPLVAVRGDDGTVRVFRNACRHRGVQVAAGQGCAQAFTCPYHGWTYGLDGRLRAIPHERGFPELEKTARGLVPVTSREVGGLVFVIQDQPAAEAMPEEPPDLLPPVFRLLSADSIEVAANWKLFAESFLEGYHIRATHAQTFYPVQFDNLNVVEHAGRCSRITFPYRAVDKLRDAPVGTNRVDGKLTYLYHLFPSVMLATFPGRRVLVVLEPLDPGRTLQFSYTLTDRDPDTPTAGHTVRDGLDFVDAGAREDREVVASAQRGLASGANGFLEFGLFEGAIVHFHRNLHELLDP